MGLFGALSKLGVKQAAKELEENRVAKIKSFEQSNLIRFAKEQDALDNVLLKFEGLPITYFETPTDEKTKEIAYGIVAKLLKKPEYQELVAGSITYFIIADSITGKATNGLIACEKGIIDGGFVTCTQKNEIKSVESDKGWLYLVLNDGQKRYLTSMDNKKIKAESERFLQLFRYLYCR